MTNIVSIPFHIGDFLSGTLHMDTLEKGAYIMLLMAHYQRGMEGLPNDDKMLARIAGVSAKVWQRIRPIMEEKFTVTDSHWVNEECVKTSIARPHLPKTDKALIMERDGEQCAYCGTEDGPFHIDHIFPVCLGGTNDHDNLTVACAPCNLSKGGKTLEQWRGVQ